MGEYAAFLLILVFGFACGYGTARARGSRKTSSEISVAQDEEEKGERDTKTSEFGRAVISLLQLDPRKLSTTFAKWHDEAGCCTICITYHLDQSDMDIIRARTSNWRRRDDNRSHQEPSEPWS